MGGKSSEITAGVLELVDEEDSKSFGVTLVWVRVPPPAPPSPRTAQVRGDFLCWKTVQNRVCRGHLGAVIQMRVDIRGCGNVAMPQPFLDVFQADTVRIKQTRAAMTKIVIPNTAQTGFFQYERKILCDKVRLDALTDFIHIDVIQKLRAIRVAAYPLVSPESFGVKPLQLRSHIGSKLTGHMNQPLTTPCFSARMSSFAA